jgi:V/A-type H+-transporting ATPase subunit D
MPRKTIAPTRSNFLRMQRSYERARQGYELLERKRQILVMELMGLMEAARVAQLRVQEAMRRAFEALERAAIAAGSERLVREASGIPAGHTITIQTRSVMGVKVPRIAFQCQEHPLAFGLLAGASGADEVRHGFHDVLDPIASLAEVENAVLRLAREIKRTRRRIHALENIFLPEYESVLKYIGDSLEERDREDLVIMKKVKRMRQSMNERPGMRSGPQQRHV